MPTKQGAMGEKPDGRLYSRVSRRCVTLLKHIRSGQRFELGEIASEVREADYPEFMLLRAGRLVRMNTFRIRDYLSFLSALGLLKRSDKKYLLNITKRTTDAHWAQTLSDAAREYLAEQVQEKPSDLPQFLERIRKRLHSNHRVPTISAILGEAGVEGARSEELFRWSLYLYTDGDACPFDVRQYPHIIKKAGKRR